MRRILAVSLLPLLAACLLHRHASVPTAALRSPARDSLLAADASRGDSVAARGAVQGMMIWTTPDVIFLRPGVPAVFGQGAVRALLELSPAAVGARPRWQPLGGGLSADGLAGYTFGIAAHTVPGTAGADVLRLDRYIAFWTRAVGRVWRIAAYAEIGPATGQPPERVEGTRIPRPPTTDPRTIRALMNADSLFADHAYTDGTASAFAATIAPDGVLFAGSELVIGPNGARAFYRSPSAPTSLVWYPVYAMAAASGDLGFTIGEFITTSVGSAGTPVQRFGKYITVWRLQSDGRWRFVVDGGSLRPTPVN